MDEASASFRAGFGRSAFCSAEHHPGTAVAILVEERVELGHTNQELQFRHYRETREAGASCEVVEHPAKGANEPGGDQRVFYLAGRIKTSQLGSN